MEKLGAFTSLTLLFAFALLVSSDEDCVQIIYIKTGNKIEAGTDAMVSIKLYDAYGNSVGDTNLWDRGIIYGHNYFEMGNLDIFGIKSKCLSSKVCKIELSQANNLRWSGWYVDYVKVSTNIYNTLLCVHTEFQINQWLSVDEPPYELSVTKDLCNSIDGLAMADNQKASLFNISRTI